MTHRTRRDTPDILRKIVAVKRGEVERQKALVPVSELKRRIESPDHPPALNMAGALMGDDVRVIAEVKKASPTKGLLRADFEPVALARAYADNGAAAVSVLTDERHFQGSIEHLSAVRNEVGAQGIPVLRKEFIFDDYQVYEARAAGADAILLIVSMLSQARLAELVDLARSFWMQCLVEVHDGNELEAAVGAGAEIIGINNRDLHTFNVDLGVTERLASSVPAGKIVVSESGIQSREDVRRLGRAGAHAVLVGEALVTASDPGARLRSLL